MPRFRKFSVSRAYFSWLCPKKAYNLDTNMNGGERPFVVTGLYERYLPMDIYPMYLLKACLAGDIDKMENLGIYEVTEEDFALCEFVDPSKIEIQQIIRDGINLMIRGGLKMGLRKFMDNIKPTFSKGRQAGLSGVDVRCVRNVPLRTRHHDLEGCAHPRLQRHETYDDHGRRGADAGFSVRLLQYGHPGRTRRAFRIFFYGLVRVLPMVCVSYIVGLGIEFAFAQVRGHEVNEGFLVSGLLIPMIMPVVDPLWMVALSTAFAVVFGKEVFGGTGMNVFNPALLLARAFAFFAYTPSMSGATVWIAGMTSGEGAWWTASPAQRRSKT